MIKTQITVRNNEWGLSLQSEEVENYIPYPDTQEVVVLNTPRDSSIVKDWEKHFFKKWFPQWEQKDPSEEGPSEQPTAD